MLEKYSEIYQVPSYDTDITNTMTPVAFLNHAQEAANRNAETLGFGYDALRESNTAWILSRIHVDFHNMPIWRQTINLKSWHKGTFSLFYLRDFTVEDEDGNRLISATTSWLILNLESRRIVRDNALAQEYENCIKENAVEEPAPKIVVPKSTEFHLAVEHKVVYSDIDTNGHVNNVRYVLWAMDAIDFDITSQRNLKELDINYNHEIKPGETVLIYINKSFQEDGSIIYLVDGKVNGQSSFIMRLKF